MDDKKLKEIIHAYAAGCADPEDLYPVIQQGNSMIRLNDPELGELQNVISLLPAILEIETPNPNVKDRVAKKLYAIRDEILAKQKIQTSVPLENFDPAEKLLSKDLLEEREVKVPAEEPNEKLTSPTEPVNYDKGNEEKYSYTIPEQRTTTETEYIPRQYEKESVIIKKEKKGLLITLVIFFILVSILASGAVYYLLNEELTINKEQITSLKNEVNVLNEEIVRLNKIQRIIAILGSKDVRTINLNGTVDNPTGFGKLILDSESKEGVLQLYNMSNLTNQQIYQLWLISKEQPFSLGIYKPRINGEYLPVNEFPDVQFENIDSFIVTIEEENGSDSPKGLTHLSYTMKSKSR